MHINYFVQQAFFDTSPLTYSILSKIFIPQKCRWFFCHLKLRKAMILRASAVSPINSICSHLFAISVYLPLIFWLYSLFSAKFYQIILNLELCAWFYGQGQKKLGLSVDCWCYHAKIIGLFANYPLYKEIWDETFETFWSKRINLFCILSARLIAISQKWKQILYS